MSDTESGVDHLDRLPDSLLLLLFNRISDVKSLARCSLVSRRFRSLVHSLLRVDCALSDDSTTTAAASSSHPIYNYNKAAKSLLLRFFSRPSTPSPPTVPLPPPPLLAPHHPPTSPTLLAQ